MYVFSNIVKKNKQTESTLKRKVNEFILQFVRFLKKIREMIAG
jgi:hypothetical protein